MEHTKITRQRMRSGSASSRDAIAKKRTDESSWAKPRPKTLYLNLRTLAIEQSKADAINLKASGMLAFNTHNGKKMNKNSMDGPSVSRP
jgi:hypothetical protein